MFFAAAQSGKCRIPQGRLYYQTSKRCITEGVAEYEKNKPDPVHHLTDEFKASACALDPTDEQSMMGFLDTYGTVSADKTFTTD